MSVFEKQHDIFVSSHVNRTIEELTYKKQKNIHMYIVCLRESAVYENSYAMNIHTYTYMYKGNVQSKYYYILDNTKIAQRSLL